MMSSIYFNRWVKFEEDVEEGGNRWSKPYVATLSLHSLFELRSMLLNGTICLDMQANSLEDICDNFLDIMINANQVKKLQGFSHIKLFIYADYHMQPVVYFDQSLGAAQFKYWSKSPFSVFFIHF